MDPNVNLREQREIARRLLTFEVGTTSWIADAQALAERVEALDAWLTAGGFLPDLWDNEAVRGDLPCS